MYVVSGEGRYSLDILNSLVARPSHHPVFDGNTESKISGCGKAWEWGYSLSACIASLQFTQLTVYSGFTIVQTITYSTQSKSWSIHVWQWFILHMLSLPKVRLQGQVELHLHNIQHATILLWRAISEVYIIFPPPPMLPQTYLPSWLLHLTNVFCLLVLFYLDMLHYSLNACQSAVRISAKLRRWLRSKHNKLC